MNAKIDNAKKNGIRFEQHFLRKVQEIIPGSTSSKKSQDSNHKYYCDIVSDDFLIELKSHRTKLEDLEYEGLNVLSSIAQNGLEKADAKDTESGLIFQLLKLCNDVTSFNKKAIVIVGCYKEEVNKQFNSWMNNSEQAFARYHDYIALLIEPNWSGICHVEPSVFWSLLRERKSFEAVYGFYREWFRAGFSIFTQWDKTDGALKEILNSVMVPEIETQIKIHTLQNKYKEEGEDFYYTLQDSSNAHEDPIKVDYQEGFAFNESTKDWFTYPEQAQIQSVQKITKDQVTLFKPDQLELIEKAVIDHEPFSAISVKVGHASNYIAQVISPAKGSYSREEYELFRNWFIHICLESSHWETPSDKCNLDQLKLITDSLRIKLRGHKAQNTGLRKIKLELESQVKELTESRVRQRNTINSLELKIKKQEEEIKAMTNAETQKDKGLSQLEKEAYEAEIEKLNDFIQGHKARVENFKLSNEELKGIIERSEVRALETESVKLQDEIKELQEELELEKLKTESIRESIHDAYLKDLERYRKIIDVLLERQDRQENE